MIDVNVIDFIAEMNILLTIRMKHKVTQNITLNMPHSDVQKVTISVKVIMDLLAAQCAPMIYHFWPDL